MESFSCFLRTWRDDEPQGSEDEDEIKRFMKETKWGKKFMEGA
jgi:hypothetical protein